MKRNPLTDEGVAVLKAMNIDAQADSPFWITRDDPTPEPDAVVPDDDEEYFDETLKQKEIRYLAMTTRLSLVPLREGYALDDIPEDLAASYLRAFRMSEVLNHDCAVELRKVVIEQREEICRSRTAHEQEKRNGALAEWMYFFAFVALLIVTVISLRMAMNQ